MCFSREPTQRPVDIGTFPKPPHNAPDEIVNYDRRIPVEGGAFLACEDRPLSIARQMKEAGALAETSRGDPVHKKKGPDRGDR